MAKIPGRRTTINRDTQAYRILELIAVSGEIPAELIRRIQGGNEYKNKLITMLKEKKLIHTYYQDGVRGYRLNSGAKGLLLSDNRDRFEFLLTGNIETKSRVSSFPAQTKQ